ncbi:hypothetical protein [Sphingobacterium daejeonense]|uniref:hypothetical protein n=1 Tax=Sphingobacterium daejeonense TaxID=371142 RepID=UPI0010C4BACD|nr:hypothetical protein [Sphingobacterium daejeonense]VTP95831.1 Uncharacterised protein [Sphingobacterium daejeonense]
MKKKKSKTHNYSRHRSILSDTLAYETPLTFSNRYFYRFLRNNNIDLITSNDKNSHQTIIFNGKGDAILETVIRVLFQVENSLALKEIKFTNYSNCLHTINNLLAFNSLTSFLLTLNGLLELRITNRRSFLKLLSSIDGLKGEAEYISKSQKRIYKGDDLKFSVEKVISLILQRYCDVTIDLKKLTIKCSANHPLLPNFLGYEIIKENILKLNEKKLRRTSFNYKISHKDNDYRELSIPHPKTQTEIINFYEEYKELIIYYCGVSPYSIRKPDSIANFIFFNDRFHLEHKGDKYDNVEESGKGI